jgi:uncharacterized protein YecE (DUF72 family)
LRLLCAVRDIRLGLCGWTISQREYFERFPVVEVQQTFYDPPAKAVMARWRATAPPEFEFTLKAWQVITHQGTSSTYRRLKRPLSDAQRAEAGSFRWNQTTRDAWSLTLECAKILRATSVLFQCPASFRPTDDNVARMREFFKEAAREGLRFLWEPRGDSWPYELIEQLCRELDLLHVVDPLVHRCVTPELLYYRLHGTTGARHVYTDQELARLAALLDGDGTAYVMFNNMPRDNDSERFRRLLAKR